MFFYIYSATLIGVLVWYHPDGVDAAMLIIGAAVSACFGALGSKLSE